MSSKSEQYTRILIAVEDNECSKKALQHGYKLAKMMQASVALVSVLEPATPTNYGIDPLLGQQPLVVPPESGEVREEQVRGFLEEISQNLSGIDEVFTFHRMGSPRQEILKVAEEWDADLIVMGTHGRTGFDLFISGSVSERVVRKAPCPVLVVPSKC